MNRRRFLSTLGATTVATLHSDAVEKLEAANRFASQRSPNALARDEDYWFRVQHAFTIDRGNINLNNGSVCPSPRVVQEAMNQYLTIMNMSPSYYVDEFLGPHINMVRRRLATAFGCDPEELAIMRNTTEAMEVIQLGLPLQPGDEVLTTTQDYTGMLTTWRQRERRDGIVMKTFRFPVPPANMDELYQRFEEAVTPRTKAILMSHITFTTGQIFPIRKICRMARERGIDTLVDGAHSFGQIPVTRDDLDCDYYGTSLHKWLTAPVGTGFLYVRREKIAKIWSLYASGEEMKDNIRKFERVGTGPVANRNAINEALTFQETLGVKRKAARLRYLRELWTERLTELPGVNVLTPMDPEQAAGIGALTIDGIAPGRLTEYLLDKHQIHVRPRFDGEYHWRLGGSSAAQEFSSIRISPNIYTTVNEINAFADAIEMVSRRGLV